MKISSQITQAEVENWLHFTWITAAACSSPLKRLEVNGSKCRVIHDGDVIYFGMLIYEAVRIYNEIGEEVVEDVEQGEARNS